MTKKSIKVGAVCIVSRCRVVHAGFALPKERHGFLLWFLFWLRVGPRKAPVMGNRTLLTPLTNLIIVAPLGIERMKQSALVAECVKLRRLPLAVGARQGLLPFTVVRIVLAHLGPRAIPLLNRDATHATFVRPVLVPI